MLQVRLGVIRKRIVVVWSTMEIVMERGSSQAKNGFSCLTFRNPDSVISCPPYYHSNVKEEMQKGVVTH